MIAKPEEQEGRSSLHRRGSDSPATLGQRDFKGIQGGIQDMIGQVLNKGVGPGQIMLIFPHREIELGQEFLRFEAQPVFEISGQSGQIQAKLWFCGGALGLWVLMPAPYCFRASRVKCRTSWLVPTASRAERISSSI